MRLNAPRRATGDLTSMDKANVLATSTLWRQTVAISRRNIRASRSIISTWTMPRCRSCCARRNSTSILTSNLFGDILSDEAAALAGSIGLIPSMSRGRADQPALYEPIHGSAPTLAGKDVACPLGAILSATMMLRESFGLEIEAQWIETAVDRALEHGYRTSDIAEPAAVPCAVPNSPNKSAANYTTCWSITNAMAGAFRRSVFR